MSPRDEAPTLFARANAKAPPPGPALLAAVDGMKPVQARVPARTLAAIAAAGAALPALSLLRGGVRGDLDALPTAWVAGMALAWTAGLLATLLGATLPRRGSVLPDGAAAGRAALLAGATLLLLGLFATVDAPGHTTAVSPTVAGFGAAWLHCIASGLKATVPLLLAGGMGLRGLLPVGGARIAAALGAAGGAMAGLDLHFVCSFGGGLHVGLAHAGGIAVGAALGLLTLPRLLRAP